MTPKKRLQHAQRVRLLPLVLRQVSAKMSVLEGPERRSLGPLWSVYDGIPQSEHLSAHSPTRGSQDRSRARIAPCTHCGMGVIPNLQPLRVRFLSSVPMNVVGSFIVMMWALAYSCENQPVVSPETRSAANWLHQEQRKDVAFHKCARA